MIEKKIMLKNIEINTRYSLNGRQAILFLHFAGGNLNMWNGILPQLEKIIVLLFQIYVGMENQINH